MQYAIWMRIYRLFPISYFGQNMVFHFVDHENNNQKENKTSMITLQISNTK